mmetsp:Transcript_41661/g.82460  ORF Transcript_41661/g.82460 Transcript_41661/m.82460 type:complete len:160 (+) Transcript_41661:88-567(+)
MSCMRQLHGLVVGMILLLGADVALAINANAEAAAAARLREEARAFEEGGATLDAQGWKAFMDVSANSAHSDRHRQDNTDEAIAEARSIDFAISDEFAQKLYDQSGTPSLRELAQEHWAGIKPETPQQAAKVLQVQQHAPQQRAVGGLRNLLMSAGRTAL